MGVERAYFGRKKESLAYMGRDVSVPDWQVREDVVLYDGRHGDDGVGFTGFKIRLHQRGFPNDEVSYYAHHVSRISNSRLVHLPGKILRGLINTLT